MDPKGTSSLLLLLAGICFFRSGCDGDGSGLFVLRDGKSFTLGRQTVEHVTALAASESIRMVGHVGGDLTLVTLRLQALDLAAGLNVVVVEQGQRSLLMLVLYLLGLGVHLLLSLTLATVESNESVNGALGLETRLLDGQSLVELACAEDEPVYGVFDLLLNRRSTYKTRDKHGVSLLWYNSG